MDRILTSKRPNDQDGSRGIRGSARSTPGETEARHFDTSEES